MKHRAWIVFSGLIWFSIGNFLLYKGMRLLSGSSFLILLGLGIGVLKGRLVLSKTAKRVISHIAALSTPIKVSQVYGASYRWLLLGMFVLGFLLKFFPETVRGVVDVAVGVALLSGSMFYFRTARATCDTDFPVRSL